jgi:hypothetical protein
LPIENSRPFTRRSLSLSFPKPTKNEQQQEASAIIWRIRKLLIANTLSVIGEVSWDFY